MNDGVPARDRGLLVLDPDPMKDRARLTLFGCSRGDENSKSALDVQYQLARGGDKVLSR